jgi:4-hydroxymandelate oxidase
MSMKSVTTPLNVLEYEEAARDVLPLTVFDYIAGGSGDELTLRANREAFARWRLVPRVLRGISHPDLRTTVLGQPIALPVLLAPVGFHRLVHEEGETASARAARAAGTIFVASTASTYPLEEVAPHAGPWWFQVYVFRDRELTRHLVQRAEAAGARALVVTADTPVLGRREADERNRFALPDGVTWANFRDTNFAFMSEIPDGSSLSAYIAGSFDATLSWADLDWLSSITTLPVIPKGILHPDDARQAVEHGAEAIVVSNHGGRQLDSAIATLDALPAIVNAVGDAVEILLDGGVRRGTDVIKALALGARAVLIGRPYLWGLALGGSEGVQRILELLGTEIRRDLTLCGCATVEDADARLLVPAGTVAEATSPSP